MRISEGGIVNYCVQIAFQSCTTFGTSQDIILYSSSHPSSIAIKANTIPSWHIVDPVVSQCRSHDLAAVHLDSRVITMKEKIINSVEFS